MQRYRKKPIPPDEVVAFQYDGVYFPVHFLKSGEEFQVVGSGVIKIKKSQEPFSAVVHPGDYVARRQDEHINVYYPATFEAMFESMGPTYEG